MMMTVARATGWTEREIMWKIPMDRLVQYVHAVWSYDATPCYWSCYTGEAASVKDAVQQAMEAWKKQVEELE